MAPPKKDPGPTGRPHRAVAKRKFVVEPSNTGRDTWCDHELKTIDRLTSFPTKVLTLNAAGSRAVAVHEYRPLLTESCAHVQKRQKKQIDLIVLHWANCHRTNPEHLLPAPEGESPYAVPYFVGRTGAIFRYFDESLYTSTHAGRANRRSIGIEHANDGQLYATPNKGKGRPTDICYCEHGQPYCEVSDNQFWRRIEGKPYGRNDARNYALFTAEQMHATANLVCYLCEKHDIPMKPLPENMRGKNLLKVDLEKFRGIIAHLPCATGETGVDDHDDDMLQFDWALFAEAGAISDAVKDADIQLQRRLDAPGSK